MVDMSLADKIDVLNRVLSKSSKVVFFGGAGVSTESGIPDFRGNDGIYNTDGYTGEKPETILSHSFFIARTTEFYQFYKGKMLYLDAGPNAAHVKLAQLERVKCLRAVITQNIDGLHQKAGSKNVIELHGSAYRNFCMSCRKSYNVGYVAESPGIPRCVCGGIIKPDVVLYEEGLRQREVEKAIKYISEADVLIIGGTSLEVYPAAGLIRYYQGSRMVIINRTETDYDSRAWLVLRDSISRVMDAIGVPAISSKTQATA